MLLFLFAFISGLVTIAAPCIWPLLPIVLSASSTGGHRKPLGVTLGIVLSFGILTLTLSYLVRILPINLDWLRFLAVVILLVLGFSLLIPKLSQLLEGSVSKLSGKFGANRQSKNGFLGGLITGLTLGVVWTPCAGPILATIATLAATTRVNSQLVLVTFFYMLGVAIPLFIFAFLGRKILTKTPKFSKYTGKIQRIFGAIMILTAILIFTNYDKVLSANLLNLFPSYSNSLNNFESSSLIKNDLNGLKQNAGITVPQGDSSDLLNKPAPQITGITHWLNSSPLTLQQLKGKVVLIDFWTYTCINCIRTLPHVTSWYNKYKDDGFVVIGVHTPEFEFEHNTDNVAAAIKQFGIKYPVAQDNDYATWNAYNNQYWPAEYLIDSKGIVRRVDFGEGRYDETDQAIVDLLKEAGKKVSVSGSTMPDVTPNSEISPETYVGSARMEYLYPSGTVGNGQKDFTLVNGIPLNSFSFGGSWEINSEQSTSMIDSVIEYNFSAKNVNLVMGPGSTGNYRVKVLLDGKPIDSSVSGKDVKDGFITLDGQRLYDIVDLKDQSEHTLRLEFDSGIEAFAFTFG